MIDAFDEVVYNMMQDFGTTAYVIVTTHEEYDADTSENIVTQENYKVKAVFFDYLDKNSGVSAEKNTLIRSGDKQVFIQPPHKTETGITLPHLDPSKDTLKIGNKIYKIVAVKEYNTTMSKSGCILYEAYVRE